MQTLSNLITYHPHDILAFSIETERKQLGKRDLSLHLIVQVWTTSPSQRDIFNHAQQRRCIVVGADLDNNSNERHREFIVEKRDSIMAPLRTHTLYTSRLTFCTNLRKKINVQTGYVGHMIDVARTTERRKPIESKRMLNTRKKKKKTELFVVCFFTKRTRRNTIEVAKDERRTNGTPASIFTEQRHTGRWRSKEKKRKRCCSHCDPNTG